MEKRYSFAGLDYPIAEAKDFVEVMKTIEKMAEEHISFNVEQVCDIAAFCVFVDKYKLGEKRSGALSCFARENEKIGTSIDVEACKIVNLVPIMEDIKRKINVSEAIKENNLIPDCVNPDVYTSINRARRALKTSKTADEAMYIAALLNNYKLKKQSLPKDIGKFLAKLIKQQEKEKTKTKALVEDELE